MPIIEAYLDDLIKNSTLDVPAWNIEAARKGGKSGWNYIDGCMAGCLRRDGIPYVTDDTAFLEAPEVCGTLAFLAAVFLGEDSAHAEEFLGSRKAYESAAALFAHKRCRPRKLLEEWREYLHTDTPAYAQLTDAAHYADVREFLDAVRLGGDGDVTLPSGDTSSGAVRLGGFTGSNIQQFVRMILSKLSSCNIKRSSCICFKLRFVPMK